MINMIPLDILMINMIPLDILMTFKTLCSILNILM